MPSVGFDESSGFLMLYICMDFLRKHHHKAEWNTYLLQLVISTGRNPCATSLVTSKQYWKLQQSAEWRLWGIQRFQDIPKQHGNNKEQDDNRAQSNFHHETSPPVVILHRYGWKYVPLYLRTLYGWMLLYRSVADAYLYPLHKLRV